MAVLMQHGEFRDGKFILDSGSEGLNITLMSRTGILPEADFYCPIPYEPLSVLTEFVVESEIAKGPDGLLDRVFALMVKELELADPAWCEKMSLRTLNADTIREAWFEDRKRHGPFTRRKRISTRLNAINANGAPWPGAIPSFDCMRWFRRLCPTSTKRTESALSRASPACLSTTMPPSRRSLSAGCLRFARPASLAWRRSAMITRLMPAAIGQSSPHKRPFIVSTSLLMRAGKSRLKQTICLSHAARTA